MSALMAALRGLGALPQLVKAVERIGDKLDEKAAMERLAEKRDDVHARIDAVKRLPQSASDGGAGLDGSTPGGTEPGGERGAGG